MARARGGKRKSSARGARQDGYINTVSGHGTSRDRRTHTRFRGDIVADVEAVDLWRSDDILKRVIEMRPETAMRRGFTIKVADKNGKETAEDLQDEADRLDLAEKVKLAGQMERAFGGSAIMPVLDGAVGDLEEPIDDYMDSIVAVDALHVFEPRELIPERWYTSIAGDKWRRPSVYRLQPLSGATGRPMSPVLIHESRLVIFPGIRVSSQVLAGQRPGWGDSVLNVVRAVAADFGLAWGSVATLIHDFAQGVIKLGDLAEIMSKKNGEELLAIRMAAIDAWRSSLRATVLDKNDEFIRTNTPVTGLEGLVIQLAQRVAAAAATPAALLFGMSPAGLNATGDFDMRGWYDSCDGQRQAYRHPIKRIVRFTALQIDGPCKGEEPEQFSIDFPPLWSPSAKEQAEERYLIAQADQIYYNIGSASSDDVAKSRWGGDSFSPEMTIDWDAREKQAALELTITPEAAAAMGRVPPAKAAGTPADPAAPDVAASAVAPAEVAAPGSTVRVAAHDRRVGT